ncbi:hypothetical protein A3A14_01180 [Candidatus Daviesbacteria bacterium RIFCSPLOWO2_01_FULL_43_38]|uniref:PIN domain-containing protein n=1 Tax=Candidatus Daviesbacteria bacterium RIFCSPHIGHO2_12_FULL_43_11 TaxID=1797780 RepID=A0A1F5K267_9BACT|nr:MAG: hypothetical protein A2874_01775 [Candidatus Daviesbacteria bacterium RIFCSPHIGHO2_01_FULL_43_17]OGE34801.1 MAG: hypothetical protein A3E45_02390 [Candidatus Daviesbacteria bacterium RIFCSPHIGHO2_12_FULL_43_11]OGE63213.1 MAG: hypothetical protein A3A14_01180 [Candidatus Daviesbacteria bacterium RIFCSPLOWO2_01_FULL_43_38]OGE69151.1 MAG: hypothetical protein A3J21_01970 [Candidatus Daviesbacteria bacterium RIFCSPLOWO2_02_FULL_43_11]
MRELILDTNVFLRFFLKDILPQTIKARKLLQQAKTGKILIIVPQIVIFEIVFAFEKLYKFPKTEIIDKINVLLGTNYLKIQDKEIFGEAVLLFQRHNLSLPDCFIHSYAKQNNASVFSFDKNLNKLG